MTAAARTLPETIEEALESHGRGDLRRAAALYEGVVAEAPDHALALHNLGVIRAGEGRVEEALALITRATLSDPSSAGALCSLAALLLQSGRRDQARQRWLQALAVDPAAAQALTGLADLDAEDGNADRAQGLYEQALAADPHHCAALTGLGIQLMGRGLPREAGERFALALALRPDHAPAHYNVASALKALGRTEEAKVFFRQALDIDPRFADAWTNLGNVLRDDGDLDEALACHVRAAALKPSDMAVQLNLGHVLRDRGDAEAARAAFDAALELDPADAAAALCRCMAELPLAYRDEADIARRRAAYAERLEGLVRLWDADPRPEIWSRAIGSSQPFYLAYQGLDDRALQARYGALVCKIMSASRPQAEIAPPPARGERIRVGVISGFFSAHSNWKIPISGWVRGMDRSRFEVIGYHTGVKQDASTEEARSLCDRFVQGPLGPELWRDRILEDRPHVLIYPEIGMDPMAIRLAAQRLAPLQCVSWGHPETSGLPTMDAFLSSALMEPEGAEAFYTEEMVRLPGLGVRLEPPAEAAETLSRAELGYREGAIVFWCGQSLPKYLPQFDDIYPRIATEVGDCQFVFIGAAQRCEAERIFLQRLDSAFSRHGLKAADHLVVLPRMGKSRFMGAIAASDVVLDSLEWSGCNSILEGLGAGLPIVVHRGEFMRGRHAAAILQVLGVSEAIANDIDEFVRLAARLGRDPARRAEFGSRILAGRDGLYGDDAPVRALEAFIEAKLAQGART
jgi:predicted O-linked N-acetylglucosamine transferase (SPINDLY family)